MKYYYIPTTGWLISYNSHTAYFHSLTTYTFLLIIFTNPIIYIYNSVFIHQDVKHAASLENTEDGLELLEV